MRRNAFRFVTTAAVLAAGLHVALPVNANRGDVIVIWKDYVVAQKRLQFDLARLLASNWPELKGIANLQRDQQFAALEIRDRKFRYLLEHDPDRIVFDEGLTAFAEFKWTEQDDNKLRAVDPAFAKLQIWAEKNAERLARHPQLAAVGESVLALQRDENYLLVLERFRARLDDLESALTSIGARGRTSKPLNGE